MLLDYIVLKEDGKNWAEAIVSTDITGLLIASLPPITRPAMRNQIDVIDGRDGDIVTELGYSAYDKPLRIALYGDYDYQKVLDYFVPKGQVIFSNEPYHYYDYQILDTIELERVIKFKKGVVTFHVQPYKYMVDEPPIFMDTAGELYNEGNVEAKPIITVNGTGTVNLSINSVAVLTINFNSDTSITIDSDKLEAYSGTTLKNRQVLGDYEKIKFDVGSNVITWSGNVTSIEIQKYSRWI